MASVLIIECWAAETRAALIENDDVRTFWFGPARGDEIYDTSPRAGRTFMGKISRINKSLNAAFVDIGQGADGFLNLSDPATKNLTEGATAQFSIKTPARGAKGATLRLSGVSAPVADIGRCAPYEDAAIEAINAIGARTDEIIIDQPLNSRSLSEAVKSKITIDHQSHSLFSRYGADEVLSRSFERRVSIPGGGALVFDETEAMTAVDVDTDGLQAASSTRLREKIALAAIKEVSRQIELRGLGGQIVIDLPLTRMGSAASRLTQEIKRVATEIEDARAISLANTGLLSFATPRRTLSLLDAFTEPSTGAPISGRQYTNEWLAKSAMRALELKLREDGSARLQLRVRAPIEAYIASHKRWLERLQDRYSARFDVIASSDLEGVDYDIVKL